MIGSFIHELIYLLFLEYQCGNYDSDDCKAEYGNAINNGNLEYFYHRCATEGGSQPLRKRCSLCCSDDEPSKYGYEGTTLHETLTFCIR